MEFVRKSCESVSEGDRDGGEHQERRHLFREFFLDLPGELDEDQLGRVRAALRDTWSEIRKESSKALRARAVGLSAGSAARLVDSFLDPLVKVRTSSDMSWQSVHGNLLGLFALIPTFQLLPPPEVKERSSVRGSRVEMLKEVCLQAFSHPQLPVRETAESCLHDVGMHIGSLGKSFLGKCLDQIGTLAERDVSRCTEVHAAELDGLLLYVGRMISDENGLLEGMLGDKSDPEKVSVIVMRQVHVCMQHPSATVRQRTAFVLVQCCRCNDLLHVKAEYVRLSVNAVIEILSDNKVKWRIIEGYLIAVETLLLDLLEAEVSSLRMLLQPTNESATISSVNMDILRLVSPLIQEINSLTRHRVFEVRRMVSQLVPTLARVVVACTASENYYPTIANLSEGSGTVHVGDNLPAVAFVNEVCRSVSYLQELSVENSLADLCSTTVNEKTILDEAALICEPYLLWSKHTRRRAGEETKQKQFHSIFSTLSQENYRSNCTMGSILTLATAGLTFVTEISADITVLERSLMSAGIISLDIVEHGILEWASLKQEFRGRSKDSELMSPCFQCLGILQMQTYKSNENHLTALSDVLSLAKLPLPSDPCTILSSVCDPSVDPNLASFSIEEKISRRISQKGDIHSLNAMNKNLLEAIFPAVPSILDKLTTLELVMILLLYSQWAHCLMTNSYWQLGWGSRASSKRCILETMHMSMSVLNIRIKSSDDALHSTRCFKDSFASVLSSLSMAFLTSSQEEEQKLGGSSKLDLKSGQLILTITLLVMNTMKSVTGSIEDKSGSQWKEDVRRLCSYISSNCESASRRPSANCASISEDVDCLDDDLEHLMSTNNSNFIDDDEFSDWDDSDSDTDSDVTPCEDRKSHTGDSGWANMSGSNFDSMIIQHTIQEIGVLLS